jgi:3-carboxy-cis,cis-muconate cycloisomerase
LTFDELYVPAAVREATSDRAWVQAMLDFEAALVRAQARAGLIPNEAADEIGAACHGDRFDAAALGQEGHAAANPAAPLVRALTAAVEGDGARYVHRGAASQDVVDTAMMLVARRALEPIGAELDGVAAACARLAEEHRSTPMVARTLLQQALPTTFGLVAAGWLDAVGDARRRLAAAPLAAQLGGAAGTLASLGEDGRQVLALLAEELGLDDPGVPWHTARGRVAGLGAALALAAGSVEKVALDVVLLAQTEVGEVGEASNGGRGGSSTMPHKRNPVGSAVAIACARQVQGAAGVLLGAMAQELQRAAGAWQAEWPALTSALAYTGGAAGALREALDGLEVRPERMRENLDAGGGLVMAESAATALAERLGRLEAHELMQAAARRAVDEGRPLREVLAEDGQLSDDELDRALDPSSYLGSARQFVDGALARYNEGQ